MPPSRWGVARLQLAARDPDWESVGQRHGTERGYLVHIDELPTQATGGLTSWNYTWYLLLYQWLNTLRPRQNDCYFPDDISKCIFLNENVWNLNMISMKFVPEGGINNILAFVQIMAWRHPGDKQLSEPMVVSLLMHICVTCSQWVNARVW